MTRSTRLLIAVVVFCNGLTLAAPAMAAGKPSKGPIPKSSSGSGNAGETVADLVGWVVPGIRTFQFALRAAEDWSTKENPTAVTVKYEHIRVLGKLTLVQYKSSIILEDSDESWFGNNSIKLSVPCTFSYSVDLNQISSYSAKFDDQARQLAINMPSVQLDDPVPDWENMTMLEKSSPWTRSAQSFYELQERAKGRKLTAAARTHGEKWLGWAENKARPELEKRIQGIVSLTDPSIRVTVR
ncbi:MAG: DUF4230 domain-containing protein [Planctomycetia bacterium]|nr:DUF4230 domain-containing protein [Planctomycetia bacterium]